MPPMLSVGYAVALYYLFSFLISGAGKLFLYQDFYPDTLAIWEYIISFMLSLLLRGPL